MEKVGSAVGDYYIYSFLYITHLHSSYVVRYREDAPVVFNLPGRNTALSLFSHACSSETNPHNSITKDAQNLQ